MPADAPKRMQMSRKAGTNLHAASHALNGRPVRVVARPTKFGNPFKFVQDEGCFVVTTAEGAEVVALFRQWLCDDPRGREFADLAKTELRGHNLACFCSQDDACHADVLLEIANAEPPLG